MCFRPAEISMKTCPSCGKICKPVDTVCPDCGTPLESGPKGFDADAPTGAPTAPGAPVAPGAPKPPAGEPKPPSA